MKKVDVIAILAIMSLVLFVFFAAESVQTFDLRYLFPAIVCLVASFICAVYCLVKENGSKR